MISLDDINVGDLVVFATIRTDVTQTLAFGVALRRLAQDEITGSFDGLPGTTGTPSAALYVMRSDNLSPVAVSENMIVSHFAANKAALDVLLLAAPLGAGLTAPSDSPAW